MDLMTHVPPGGRPPSPWPGSQHEDQHRWQLDQVRTLGEAGGALRAVAEELSAAHRSGWRLVQPMARGRLLAERASRRSRATTTPPPSVAVLAPALPPWRLRVVDEPPVDGDTVLDLADGSTPRTPVLARVGPSWAQVAGPPLPAGTSAALLPRLEGIEDGGRAWALAPARVGPVLDVVAAGSALRVHEVRSGALVRTLETLTFLHCADRAATLLQAAAAYERLARAADAMAAAGGRLLGTEDGFLHVGYDA